MQKQKMIEYLTYPRSWRMSRYAHKAEKYVEIGTMMFLLPTDIFSTNHKF